MKLKRCIFAGIAIVATIGVVVCSMRTNATTTPQISDSALPYSDFAAEIRTDSITELIVEFGNVPYSSTAVKSIRFKNTTDAPIAFVDYRTTCRCTTIELPRTPISPNEWAEAEIVFDSRGEFGTVGNYIEVKTSDERCIVGIWTSAEVIN